jgi:hypothetical protein
LAPKFLQEILVELGRRAVAELGTTKFSTEKVTRLSRPAFANQTSSAIALTTSTTHTFKMRPLTEPETKVLFEKLATYCGKGISNLIADPSGGTDRNVFRVQVRIPPKLPSQTPP